MKYTIKIKEINIGKFEVKADSRDEAIAKLEQEYWNNPNEFVLEPEDTFFE